MSSDGGRVVFSTLSNANSALARNIFVYDRTTGTNTLASILPTGAAVAANEGSLSADGRYLAFWPGSSSNETYVRDLETGETKQAFNVRPTVFGGISPGGKYVRIFTSVSLLLVDWRTGQMLQLSRGNTLETPMTRDNSVILLYKSEPVVTPRPPPPETYSLYLYSLAQNSSNLVATNVSAATISTDGQVIAYLQRDASNVFSLYTYEVSSGQATLVDFPNPDPAFRIRTTPVLNDDGHYLAFTTTSALVDVSDTNAFNKVYWCDRISKQVTLVSQTPEGKAGNFGSSDPSLSANGRTVAFQSSASDLVSNDLNTVSDVFVARISSSPSTDSDHDGLDDSWELANFGNLSATASEDSDNDGFSNLGEFLAGTDPKNVSSNFTFQPLTVSTDGKLHLTWSSVAGKQYQLQFRSSLDAGDWTNLGDPQTAAGNALSTEGPLQPGTSGFYRVQLLR
jgi:hypothetical protein